MNSTFLISFLLDSIVLFLLAFAIVRGYLKGFILTVYHLGSWILSLLLTQLLYPYMAKLLHVLPVADAVQRFVGHFLKLPDLPGEAAVLIESLSIPDILKTRLLENNNYEVYRLLGVDTLSGYIVGYISNMVVNAVSIVLTFVMVFCLIKLLAMAIRVIDRLPVIHFLNRVLGVVCGAMLGVIRVWIFCLLLTFLGVFSAFSGVFPGIAGSLLTNLFYNHNFLLDSLLRIFGG